MQLGDDPNLMTIDCDIPVASNDDPLPPLILLPTSTDLCNLSLNDDGFLDAVSPDVDSPIKALYMLDEFMCSGCSRADVYNEVCHVSGREFNYMSQDDKDVQPCGHMDSGSMGTVVLWSTAPAIVLLSSGTTCISFNTPLAPLTTLILIISVYTLQMQLVIALMMHVIHVASPC